VKHNISEQDFFLVIQFRHLPQFLIQRLRIPGVVCQLFLRTTILTADSPAGNAFDAAFNLPAIQDTQRRRTIQRCLHSAGAGGFNWRLRRIESDIHAGGKQFAQRHIIIGQIHDFHVIFQSCGFISKSS
jgi:hypothetical protein